MFDDELTLHGAHVVALRLALTLAATASMVGCAGEIRRENLRTEDGSARVDSLDATAVVNGYRANRDHLSPLRVSWRNQFQFHDLWFYDAEKRAAALDAEAAQSADPTKRAALVNEAARIRSEIAQGRKPLVYDYDYWTDGRAFQVRTPLELTGPTQPPSRERPRFPDEPATPANFRSAFASMLVASWAPAQAGSLRVWNGIREEDGVAFARVSDGGIAGAVVNFQFPPLAAAAEVDGPPAQWHPLDRFFRGLASDLSVIGQQSLHGRKTVVIRRIETKLVPEGWDKKPGKLEIVTTDTAWVDPAQGFLPVRIESTVNWAFNGKALGAPEHRTPSQVVEVTDVLKTKNGGFYPRKGTVTAYCGDPTVQQDFNNLDALFAGTDRMPVMIPYQKNDWDAYTVEAGRPMPATMFVPRFPDDVAVYDENKPPAQKTETVRAPLAAGDAAPPWALASWTDGKQRQLDDFRGKLVLLEFWATWCAPCINQMPAMEDLNRKYDGRVAVVGIHTAGADVEKVRAMLKSKGVTYPSGIDSGHPDAGLTSAKYGVSGLPTLILLDRNGKVAWTSLDPRNEDWTKNAAQKLGIAWPPGKEMTTEQLRRVHVELLSDQIDKTATQ